MSTGPDLLPIRDIHLPEPDFWWPPAPAWWLMALAVALVAGRLLLSRLRRARLRRAALAELRRLERRYAVDHDAPRLAMGIEILLRRVALALLPRAQVAGRHGEAWLALLERMGEPFDEVARHALLELPYRPAGEGKAAQALLRQVRRWLRRVL